MGEHATTTAAAAPSATTPAAPLLQRKCACGTHTSGGAMCGECAHRSLSGGATADALASAPAGVSLIPHGQGRPLEPASRAVLEPAFGRDFSTVKVHTDAQAAQTAHAIHAAAYTIGDDIVFGAGQYDPRTATGTHLLAHELAHVAQHASFGRSMGECAPVPALSRPGDPAEREAELAADRVMQGHRVRITQAPQAQVHRLSTGESVGIGAAVVGGGALLGVGIAWLAGAFDRSVYSPSELMAYLDVLARTRNIQDNRDSDNKARDLVRRWVAGEVDFNLDSGHRTTGGALSGVELKRLLIREMLSGVTGDDDERAILTILERSTTPDIVLLLDPIHGLSVQDIDHKVGGDNHDRFERLLEERLPRDTAQQRRNTGPTCTGRQSLMLEYARQSAVEMVDNAIRLLSTQADAPQVRQAIDCRFHGASPAQIAQIASVFTRVRGALPRRVYHCGSEGGEAELAGMTVRDSTGASHAISCINEYAVTYGQDAGTGHATTIPEVFLCAEFFRQSAEGQAITVVHESVHMAGLLDDIQYQPGCGMNLDNALRNPDSYAYFAGDLIAQLPSTGAAAGSANPGPNLPQVTVGHFRNSGDLSEENTCPVCADLPGLGLDAQTGLNIMEVRGDIDEHRRGVEYDFKRTKERAIWRSTGGQWELLQYDPPGTDDDHTDRDESLIPVNNHIYAIDGPGLPGLNQPGPGAAAAEEFVYKASFVEFVHARVRNGPWTPVSNEFRWHSITWLEKVNGIWRRKQGENEIEAGPRSIGTALPIGPVDDVPMSPPGTGIA
jgi:hypothetical protein